VARDYYAEARDIAERLAESGQQEWSERIAQVIAEGYTATDILMGIQFQLGELVSTDAIVSDETRALAVDLRQSIQKALE
jgi:hypothetical protein